MSKTNSYNDQWQEPEYFTTRIWFRKWKCYSKIFKRHKDAIDDYNHMLSMLSRVPNAVINKSKTEIIEEDISIFDDLPQQYTVNVVWRT